jgi:hypothetical protein
VIGRTSPPSSNTTFEVVNSNNSGYTALFQDGSNNQFYISNETINHISSNVNTSPTAWLADLKSGNNNAYNMNFKVNGLDSATGQMIVGSDCNTSANFQWRTRNTLANPFINDTIERMRLTSTGQLLLSSRSNATTLTLFNALDGSMPNDGWRTLAFGKQNSNYDQAEFVYKHVGNGSGNNLLGIGFKNTTNIYCKGDCKVGVGTGSPAFTFDVAGDVGLTGQLQIQNDSPTITLRDTNNKTGYIHMNSDVLYFLGGSNNSPYSSWTQVGGQWPMTINVANNNVKIGGGLYITGSFGVYMTSMTFYAAGPFSGAWGGGETIQYSLQCTNRILCSQLNVNCDKKHKKEIVDFTADECLERVKRMKTKKYKMKNENKETVGIIAQEMLEALPECVGKIKLEGDDEEGSLVVNFEQITTAAIGAIQALAQRLAVCEATLTAKVEGLEKAVEKLSKMK